MLEYPPLWLRRLTDLQSVLCLIKLLHLIQQKFSLLLPLIQWPSPPFSWLPSMPVFGFTFNVTFSKKLSLNPALCCDPLLCLPCHIKSFYVCLSPHPVSLSMDVTVSYSHRYPHTWHSLRKCLWNSFYTLQHLFRIMDTGFSHCKTHFNVCYRRMLHISETNWQVRNDMD